MKSVLPTDIDDVDDRAVNIAEDQDQYHTLPAVITPDGIVHTREETHGNHTRP